MRSHAEIHRALEFEHLLCLSRLRDYVATNRGSDLHARGSSSLLIIIMRQALTSGQLRLLPSFWKYGTRPPVTCRPLLMSALKSDHMVLTEHRLIVGEMDRPCCHSPDTEVPGEVTVVGNLAAVSVEITRKGALKIVLKCVRTLAFMILITCSRSCSLSSNL